jgi:hypothetical protein
MLAEYRNSFNEHNVLFEEVDFKFQLRFTAAITEMSPKTDIEVYEDQPKNQTLLSATPYREWRLVVGGNGFLVPEWIADKITRALSCDEFELDGHGYTLQENGLDASRIDKYPLQSWSVVLRDTINNDSVELGFYEGFDYHFGKIPDVQRLYLRGFTKTVGSDIFNRDFNSVESLCSFMTAWFRRFHLLKGFVTLNSDRDLVFRTKDYDDYDWFLTNSPTLVGLLPYWVSLEIDATPATTLGFSNSDYIAVIWGDGSANAYTNTPAITHLYSITKRIKAYAYHDTETTISISSGNSKIVSLDGEIGTLVEIFDLDNESLKVLGNSLLSQNNTALNSFSLQGNNMNTSTIDSAILMFQDAIINGRIPNGGTLTLDGQTPPSPPSEGSMSNVLAQLKTNYTVITD